MSDHSQRPATAARKPTDGQGVFARTFCAVDHTAESLEALREADRLAPPGAMLHLVTALNPTAMSSLPMSQLEEQAWRRLREAEDLLSGDRSCDCYLAEGLEVKALSDALVDGAASVVALGGRRHHRVAGIALGSMTTAMLHAAPCSVLAAREPSAPERFPESIVVGFDGSGPATRALRVAVELADRLGAELRAVLAADGGAIAADTASVRVGEAAPGVPLEVVRARPVEGLSGYECDLLVLGSRGLGGARALGSVSERVAHRANCSVLVVR